MMLSMGAQPRGAEVSQIHRSWRKGEEKLKDEKGDERLGD